MIGFPGIGLEFQKSTEIFSVGNFVLSWYGLILAAGFLLAVFFCLRRTEHFGFKQEEILDMLFFATPAGIICARLYYVTFDGWSNYMDNPLRALYTWEGGIAIHGAIIGAVAAIVIFCRVRRLSTGAMLDISAMGLLIGQAVGRWGNFVNAEVYGTETSLPWRMTVPGNVEGVHPLFLYESLWNIIGLVFLLLLLKRRKYNGQMFTAYIAWYGLGRGLMEGMRDTSFNMMWGDMLVSQVVAIASCVIALALLFYMTLFKKHGPLLGWTEERDAYEAAKKERKGVKQPDAEETMNEEVPENGGSDGRKSAGEDNQE
jgi:phosphatidylglycerol:prolipoprotein diacylglycerol transferase